MPTNLNPSNFYLKLCQCPNVLKFTKKKGKFLGVSRVGGPDQTLTLRVRMFLLDFFLLQKEDALL
jgi:hypothetical protein